MVACTETNITHCMLIWCELIQLNSAYYISNFSKASFSHYMEAVMVLQGKTYI